MFNNERKIIMREKTLHNSDASGAKAMEIPGVGCVVQVTTQQGDNVAEAVCFVPDVVVVVDIENEGRKLVWDSLPK